MLKDLSVIFCGITRDNAREIQAVLRSIDETGNLFGDYATVVFENDSTDATRDLLCAWRDSSSHKVKLICETHYINKRPNLQFLAYCRNRYLQEINKPEYDSFTHVIMVDFDMAYGWPPGSIINSFRHSEWDVMAANGIFTSMGHMWDAFAFRTEELNEPYSSAKYGPIENFWPLINTDRYHRIYPPTMRPFPVLSAFGGLCIYRKEVLSGIGYDEASEDCEHVSLHASIRARGGRIYMNPAMLIKYNHFN